ncbi:MAG: FHA domain-containing protein [Gammaproteobacteria bacterium]|nr:FHA domain-containing protein [Gammaproteobacteria bacterium]NNF61939.1 FHA domain-containing protein [Gammaproteobacteria bacterium]
MRARLTLYFNDAPARQVYLDPNRAYVLGRGSDSDIVIPSAEASRNHARMTWEGSCWHIADLQSKNGVAVDGAAIETAALETDGWLSLGELLVKFELRTEAQADADASRHRRRFQTSVELRRSLSPSAGVESLLKKLLSSTLQLTGLRRGFAMLARADGDMEIIATAGVEGDEAAAFRGSVGAVNHALQSGKNVVSMDVQQFIPLADRPSILAGHIAALVCLPMTLLDRTIGMIYADSQDVAKVLTDLDLEILDGLIGHASTALAVAQLDKEIIDINSILRHGEIDVDKLERWQGSLAGYRHPVDAHGGRDDGDNLRWSTIAEAS